MSNAIESLLVRIDGTMDGLRKTLGDADTAVGRTDKSIGSKLSKMQDRFAKTAKSAALFGAGAAAAGVAITAKLVTAGLASADSLAKVSARLGIATEDLASLRFAAEQTGVATSTLDMALQRMTRRVAEAAQGTGEARGALDELGLSATELNELSPDQTFRRITESMGGVANQSDKVRLAMKLFDSEGVSLVQTMAAGTAGLDKFAEEARIAGLTLSQFDVAKVEAANDSMNRVKTLVSGLSQQLAVRFAPVLEAVANRFFGIAQEVDGVGAAADNTFGFMTKSVGFVADAVKGLGIVFKALRLLVEAFGVGALITLGWVLKGATELANVLLPKAMEMDYDSSAFAGFVSDLQRDVTDTYNSLRDDVLYRAWPSDSIENWVSTVSSEFNFAAIEVGKANDTMQDSISGTGEVAAEVASKLESDWDRALQGTFERIDASFAEAWKGAFDSFSDFASGIKDALKNLLAEMAHLAITKPILLSMGASMGIGSVSSAASAAGGALSGGASAAGGASTGLGGVPLGMLGTRGFLGAQSGIMSMLPGSMQSGAASIFGRMNGNIQASGELLGGGFGTGMLANAGAGVLGGMAGNAVFGQTSGIGSTLGGLAGTMIPIPILGTAIGSFLGAGLESIIGNSQPSDMTGTAALNLSDGGISIGGLGGQKFSQENRDAAASLAEQLSAFSQSIGGSSGALSIGVGSRDGLRLNGKDYGSDIDGFLDTAFRQIIDSANGLEPLIKRLAQSFQGASEDLPAFISAMAGISEAVGGNVVTQLRDAWAGQATQSVVGAYNDQIDAIRRLVTDFDGSAQSAQTLNAALQQNQSVAVQLAASIMQVSDQIGAMFASSAQQIRESVMTQEQLRASRTAERDTLMRSISGLNDPDEILRVNTEINRLNNALFQSIENATAQQAENFATYAERTDAIAQQRLTTILDGVESSQAAQNARIQTMMEGAASTQQEAANTMLIAAQTFAASFRGGELVL